MYNPNKFNFDTLKLTVTDFLSKSLNTDNIYEFNLIESTASKFIESLLVRIPLNSFYIDAHTGHNNWKVVDGVKRLGYLHLFITNDFKLCSLNYLTKLENKYYKDLDPIYKRRILETILIIHIIDVGTPTEIVENIIQRIKS